MVATAITGVITAPLLLDDVPEALERWQRALGSIGGRPVEIAVLAISGFLFFLGAVAPWLLKRREREGSAARIEAAISHPDPRVALANRAEYRAAQLRALCQRWNGRISRGKLLPYAVPDEQATIALSDALAEYESDHSIDTRALVNQLVEAKVMDADLELLVERPRSLTDLRKAADQMQHAAGRLKVREPNPLGLDRVAVLRDAYKMGTKIREGNIWGEGAPTNVTELERATSRAWERATAWGVDTYQMLRDHFPGPHERAFLGPDSDGNQAFGTTGFRLQVSRERDEGVMPDTWMDGKLKLLSAMLGEFDR